MVEEYAIPWKPWILYLLQRLVVVVVGMHDEKGSHRAILEEEVETEMNA